LKPIAPLSERFFVPLSLQSTVQRRFGCGRMGKHRFLSTFAGLCLASSRYNDE